MAENGWVGYTSDDIIMDNKNLFDILIKEENYNQFNVMYSNPEIEKIMKVNNADLKRYNGLINYIKYVGDNEKKMCSCKPSRVKSNQVIPIPNLTEILSDVCNDYSIMLKAVIDNKEAGEVNVSNVNMYSDDSLILMKLCNAFGYKHIKVKGKSISFK